MLGSLEHSDPFFVGEHDIDYICPGTIRENRFGESAVLGASGQISILDELYDTSPLRDRMLFVESEDDALTHLAVEIFSGEIPESCLQSLLCEGTDF